MRSVRVECRRAGEKIRNAPSHLVFATRVRGREGSTHPRGGANFGPGAEKLSVRLIPQSLLASPAHRVDMHAKLCFGAFLVGASPWAWDLLRQITPAKRRVYLPDSSPLGAMTYLPPALGRPNPSGLSFETCLSPLGEFPYVVPAPGNGVRAPRRGSTHSGCRAWSDWPTGNGQSIQKLFRLDKCSGVLAAIEDCRVKVNHSMSAATARYALRSILRSPRGAGH